VTDAAQVVTEAGCFPKPHSAAVVAAQDVLRRLTRDVSNFPVPGVLFKDIVPVLGSAHGLGAVVAALAELAKDGRVTKVAGIEARGFLLAAPVAVAAGVGLVPIRKAGKLPGETRRVDYALEYGTATLEIQQDAIDPGDRVLVIDDVLATGGTARAARDLLTGAGAAISGLAVLLELEALGGRAQLGPLPVCPLLVV
jgi:adenine phosphoribosyltransferase